MITVERLTLEQMQKMCSKYSDYLLSIERDYSLADFLGFNPKILLARNDDDIIAILYISHDAYEEKVIVLLFTDEHNLCKNIISHIKLHFGTYMLVALPNVINSVQGIQMYGGFYKKEIAASSACEEKNSVCRKVSSLKPYEKKFRADELPVTDVSKYISWLDSCSNEYISVKDGDLVSMLCTLKGERNVITFYWDVSEELSNLIELIDHVCKAENSNVYAIAPDMRERFLTDQGFNKVALWGIHYE